MQRYESYKPSGIKWIGDIPESWDVCRNIGLFDERKEINRPEMELLSVTINRGVIKQEEITEKRDSSNEDKSKYKVVRRDDLAYNKMRMWQGAIGRSEYEGIVSPAYVILSPRDNVYSRYYHYLYRTESFIAEANRHSYGLCLDMNSLRYEDFKTIYSPVPSHTEVERIVSFLDKKTADIDVMIAKKERLIELFSEQRTAVIAQETRGRLSGQTTRDSKIDWLGHIPVNHRLTRIGFIAKVGNGSTPNRSVLGYWNGGAIPWMNSSRVNDFEIVEADQFITRRAARECHLPVVKEGSLLIAITGEGKTRGMAAITRIDTTINQHLAYISVTDPQVDPEFLLYYLTGIYQVLRDESSAQGSTKGAITCGELAKVPVLLPPLKEQRIALVRIKNQLQHINQSRNLIQRQIDALQVFRSTLISHAVSGKMKI